MKKLLPLIVVVALAAVSCKSTKETATSNSNSTTENVVQAEPQMLATINRTACYGQCPMYKATFFDNGEVEYIGRRFVEHIGTYKTLISTEEVLKIKDKISEYDYFSLDTLYPTPIADFPSCITEVNLNGIYKKVIDRRSPPDNLKYFEKFLDSMLENRAWEKVSDNTDYYKKTQ
jgi:hypothetical protein